MTSLHVKHRPTSFDQVIGQGTVVASLKQVVKDKRAKAFIFTGPSGCGKTTLARIMANQFAGGLATVANIEEVPAADHTGVDAMREVASRALYRAVGASPVKAIILDEAHRLSGSAWDVLLKPIEEPPKHVYWFICTTNVAKIPKTIETRCLRYNLKPVSEELLFKLLCDVADAEKLEVDDDVLETVAEASNGSPRQALVFLELCQFAENPAAARQMMRSAAQMKEPVDLIRLLLKRPGANWQSAVKIINAMENVDGETVRIVAVNYLAGALAKSRSENEARNLLRVLSCFDRPYNTTDKLAPLFMSVGMVLELDR